MGMMIVVTFIVLIPFIFGIMVRCCITADEATRHAADAEAELAAFVKQNQLAAYDPERQSSGALAMSFG